MWSEWNKKKKNTSSESCDFLTSPFKKFIKLLWKLEWIMNDARGSLASHDANEGMSTCLWYNQGHLYPINYMYTGNSLDYCMFTESRIYICMKTHDTAVYIHPITWSRKIKFWEYGDNEKRWPGHWSKISLHSNMDKYQEPFLHKWKYYANN